MLNSKLSIMVALGAASLCACVCDDHPVGARFNGTVVTSGMGGSIVTPGATMAVEVKLATGSQAVGTTWKIDNNPVAYPMGFVLNGVSTSNHTIKFFPPSPHTGPGPEPVPGNASYDDKKYVIEVKYK